MYKKMSSIEGVSTPYSYCMIKINNEVDSTDTAQHTSRITLQGPPRRVDVAQPYTPWPSPLQVPVDGRDTSTSMNDFLGQDFLPTQDDDYDVTTDMADRVHTRLVMRMTGWPLRYAASLRELVCVLRSAIATHKAVYLGLAYRFRKCDPLHRTQKSSR